LFRESWILTRAALRVFERAIDFFEWDRCLPVNQANQKKLVFGKLYSVSFPKEAMKITAEGDLFDSVSHWQYLY